MPSAVEEALEGYVAGRVRAEHVVATVAAAYYGPGARAGGATGKGRQKGADVEARRRLEAVVEVIERASPGVVALSGSSDRPGFEVRLVARPFPPECEAALRQAAEAYLGRTPGARPAPGEDTAPAPHLGPLAAAAPAPAPGSPSPRPARLGFIARLALVIQRLFTARA
jgi:hypothetical protein